MMIGLCKRMKKFIKNILLFFLPVLLVFAAVVPFYRASVKWGELKDIEENLEAQRINRNILIGLGYNEQTRYYKLVNTNFYKAEIIALGTSRVMQFKKELFKNSFFNCGGAVSGNYDDYLNYLKNLDYKPETILLGLDVWVFNDAWNRNCESYTNYKKITRMNRNIAFTLTKIVKDWLRKKWKFSDLDTYPENIGFNGRVRDTGFMYDGSYYYGSIYRSTQTQDELFTDILDMISKGTMAFKWGNHIDPDTVTKLEALLAYCSQNNIQVIGFLAPFAPAVYNKMATSGNYGYLGEIEPACKKLFDAYGYEFYNYMDGSVLNFTSSYFVDGFHGSEVAYGCILMDMVKHGSSVSKYVNQKHADYLISNAYSKLTFYDPDKRKRY